MFTVMAGPDICDMCNQPINPVEMWDCPWCGQVIYPHDIDDEERWAYFVKRQDEFWAEMPPQHEIIAQIHEIKKDTDKRARRYKRTQRKEKIRRLFGKD